MTLTVIDRFTTRDGQWRVDPRPFGLTREALDKYGSWDIPGKGGAAHIFVYHQEGSMVRCFTTDGNHEMLRVTDRTGWVNFNLWASSAYWGENNGPWAVSVNGIEVARGLGLPEGAHISTFLIVGESDSGSQPPQPPDKPVSHVQVLVDGVVVFDSWGEQ